jgi:hypothetical protein
MGGCISKGASYGVEPSINTSNGTASEPPNLTPPGSSPPRWAADRAATTPAVPQSPAARARDAARARAMASYPKVSDRADDNGLSPADTKETAVADQKSARQSSSPEKTHISALSQDDIRNIAGVLSLSDLVSVSRTNKRARRDVSDLFDLHKFTESLRKNIGNFNVKTDKKALDTTQNFCSDIAHLPQDHQFPLLLELAKKIDWLPMEHRKAGYDAVRAVSDHLPVAHQDEVLGAPWMAKELRAQTNEVNNQIAKFPKVHEEERMNFFNAIMAKITALPQKYQAEALKELLTKTPIFLMQFAQSMCAVEAVLEQSASLPKELRPAVLKECIEFGKKLNCRDEIEFEKKIAVVETALKQSTSLPDELQLAVLEKCIEFTESLSLSSSAKVVGLALKKIANLSQDHQSALVKRVLDNLNKVSDADDLETFRVQSETLPPQLQAAVLGKLLERITRSGYTAVNIREQKANDHFAEAIRVQSTLWDAEPQAAVLEKFLARFGHAGGQWVSLKQFDDTLTQITKLASELTSEHHAAVLENFSGCVFVSPEDGMLYRFEAILKQSAALSSAALSSEHRAAVLKKLAGLVHGLEDDEKWEDCFEAIREQSDTLEPDHRTAVQEVLTKQMAWLGFA